MNRLERLCLDRGLRMSGKRRIILEVMAAADDHPSVEDVFKRVVGRDRHISIATVYRTLNILAEAGILLRLDLGDGRARYEEADNCRHEHLIDVQSGAVLEFHEPGIEQLIRETAQRLGYSLIDYRLELFAQLPVVGAADTQGPPDLDVQPSALVRPHVPSNRAKKHHPRP